MVAPVLVAEHVLRASGWQTGLRGSLVVAKNNGWRPAKEVGRGRYSAVAATPNREVRMAMAEVGQSCATARHANLVQIGRNETRALSLMSAPRINSGLKQLVLQLQYN
jgi:hypothetical protein